MRDGDPKTVRAYLRLFLAHILVREHQVELCGHKDTLAHAYIHETQAMARGEEDRTGVLSVPTQVLSGTPIFQEAEAMDRFPRSCPTNLASGERR
jgi:hypothetical protein